MTTPEALWINDIVRRWRVVYGPTEEPVSLSLARTHLRLRATGSPAAHPDDDWITSVGLPAAREYCEGFLMRSLALQTLEMSLNRFPGSFTSDIGPNSIELLYAPVASIVSLRYLDTAGAVQQMSTSDYALTAQGDPPSVYLTTDGADWPDTFDAPNAVRIQYIAGYNNGGSPNLTPEMPSAIKISILMMLGHLYENREAAVGDTADTTIPHELPLGVKELLRPYVLRLSCA